MYKRQLQKSDNKLLGEGYFFGMPNEEWKRILDFSKKNNVLTFREEKLMIKLKRDPSFIKPKELEELNNLMDLIKSYHFESRYQPE